MSYGLEIEASLVDELLGLPAREQRIVMLRSSDLFDAGGLDRLLEKADDLLGSDPGKARRLAEVCIELADAADAPAARPKADYVLAGASDLNGELEEALSLTRRAYDGYEKLGLELEALRTEVGRMRILLFSGDYGEALEVGAGVTEAARSEADGTGSDPEKRDLLDAQVRQNSGLCYEFLGRYDEALKSYSLAEERYASLGMLDRVSEVNSNRAILLVNNGRATRAVEILLQDLRHFEDSGLEMPRVRDMINLGYAYHQLGNYKSSLGYFEEARRILEPLDALADEYGLLLDTAAVYLELNLLEEALSAYTEARDLFVGIGAVYEKAVAAHGIGVVLTLKGDLTGAEESFVEAEGFFEEIGNIPLLVAVLLGRAELSSLSDEATGARELANRALSLVSGSGEWPLQSFYANLKLAELSLPDTEAAELHLDAAGPFLEEMSLPQLRFGFDECLGRIRSLQGRRREAEVLFERAIEEIERVRGTVTQDSMRAAFLRDKSSVYEELLKLKLESGDAPAAFEVAERAKSRSLMDLLSGISDVASVSGDAASEERLDVLQADLSAVYNMMMLGGQDDSEGAPPAPDLRGRAVELEEEIGRLRLRAAASSSTDRDVFVSPDGYDASLPNDTVLLAYHVVGEEIIAFVSTSKDVRVMRGLGEVEEIRDLLRRLDSQWDRFRSGREFSERQARMLEKSTRRILAALYDALVGPLGPLLEDAFSEVEVATDGVPRLAVVPHGPLHQAPFHAFFDGEGYLLERFEVSYAPSAAVFASCQERRSGGIGGVMIAGVSDALIPAAREEALAVSELFPEARPLLDEHASLAAVSEAVPGRSVVHLACHGMFRSDNPMFSGLKMHDGWMLASDVMKLELDGAIVALSACESGRNVVVGGDEILGLTRAFLGAKAATLLVSLWIVSDDTTAPLMRRWYEKLLAGKSPATALRESQLATMRDHPHPYYWSPFIIVGGR